MRTLTMWLVLTLLLRAEPSVGQTAPPDATAATWKTWIVASPRDLRVPPPPDDAVTRAESDEVQSLVGQRATAHDRIVYWNAGPPSYRWVQIGVDRIMSGPLKGLNAARHIALVNVAIYDATIAAWNSKLTYNRQRPSAADASLTTAVATPRTPSYPDEHAVTGAAAAGVLAYLFPQDGSHFSDLAAAAAQSRVIAGVAYPSDVKAGLALGAVVAERVIARAKSDGFDRAWTGSAPTGPGMWTGTNPLMPLAGTWQTWVLQPADRFRPTPPPAYDSAQKRAELAEIKAFKRTFDSNAGAFFAQTGVGILGQWYDYAGQWMLEDRLDTDAPRSALIYATMSIAHHDSMVSCWDAKYAYWAIRPSQLDPEVTTLFATPSHPSYPAAHGCGSAAIAAVMAHYFPTRAAFINGRAEEVAWSRLGAGLHYRSDIEVGLRMGRSVADLVIQAADQGAR